MTMLGSDAVHTSFAGCIVSGTEKSTYILLAKAGLRMRARHKSVQRRRCHCRLLATSINFSNITKELYTIVPSYLTKLYHRETISSDTR